MNIEFGVRTGSPATREETSVPLNIVVTGNFSGHERPEWVEGEAEKFGNMFNLGPLELDSVVAKLSPAIKIEGEDGEMSVSFGEIDDFHPDSLYRNLPVFEIIKSLKRALDDPETSEKALSIASQLTGVTIDQPLAEPKQSAKEDAPDIFERLLGASSGGSTPVRDSVQKLLSDAVSEESLSNPHAGIDQAKTALDGLNQEAMRDILRSPNFKSLEASWRAVDWLNQQIESTEEVAIWLLDVGRSRPADWAPAALPVVQRSLSGDVPSLIVALDEMGDDGRTAEHLTSLGNLGVAADCPTVVGAAASLTGLQKPTDNYRTIDVSDFGSENEQAVDSFRQSGAATRVGLGFPRILLRQPFGKKTDPVDSFDFEELASKPDHESFCWGSAAIALAAIWIAQQADPDSKPQISDMPMVVFDDGGGQSVMPAAEIYISDSAAEKLLGNGIVPILGKLGDTSLSVPRLQSASDTPRSL